MRVIDCVQKSPEWWRVRRGVPTASEFDRILTPKKMTASASQEPYIHKLIAERYASIYPDESGFVSNAMANGIAAEPTARAWYSFDQNVEVVEVGFCFSDCGRYGCSPDGLIGDEGCLEIKCPSLETQAKYLLEGGLPTEYRGQVHGELIVTGRKWCDFISYCDGLPPFRIRVEPNEFTAALKKELNEFCQKYQKAIEQIESLRH